MDDTSAFLRCSVVLVVFTIVVTRARAAYTAVVEGVNGMIFLVKAFRWMSWKV